MILYHNLLSVSIVSATVFNGFRFVADFLCLSDRSLWGCRFCTVTGTHIELLICRCRSSAPSIDLCSSLNGRLPPGRSPLSYTRFCRAVWELMPPQTEDRAREITVQAVGAFLFSVPLPVEIRRWRHLLPLGTDDRRVYANGERPGGSRPFSEGHKFRASDRHLTNLLNSI